MLWVICSKVRTDSSWSLHLSMVLIAQAPKMPTEHLQVARQLLAEKIYQKIHRVLSSNKIEHIVLKGPHLASVYYAQRWQRGYNDIDILVRSIDFPSAINFLLEAGFTIRPSPAYRRATAEAAYDCQMQSPGGSVVEVHHDLSPYNLYPVDSGSLFSRASFFSFGHVPARGLSVEDLLLHLVIHAAKSQFFIIERKHVRDIEVLVCSGLIDWKLFLERARTAGCCAAAWFFLKAAELDEDSTVPDWLMNKLEPGRMVQRWAACWLDFRAFPLLRHPNLPRSIRRLLLAPVLVDGWMQLFGAAIMFSRVRLRDQWLWLKSSLPI